MERLDLPTRVALIEQRMASFESNFRQYAEERKEQLDRFEVKLDWVTKRVLLLMGGIGVVSILFQAALHFVK